MAEFLIWKYVPGTEQDQNKLTCRHRIMNWTTWERMRKLFLKINKNKNSIPKITIRKG